MGRCEPGRDWRTGSLDRRALDCRLGSSALGKPFHLRELRKLAELRRGAALQSTTPVVATDLVLSGDAALSGTVQSQNITLASGAVLRPLTGGELSLMVPGRLTVAAGARIDVSGLGYAGGWYDFDNAIIANVVCTVVGTVVTHIS